MSLFMGLGIRSSSSRPPPPQVLSCFGTSIRPSSLGSWYSVVPPEKREMAFLRHPTEIRLVGPAQRPVRTLLGRPTVDAPPKRKRPHRFGPSLDAHTPSFTTSGGGRDCVGNCFPIQNHVHPLIAASQHETRSSHLRFCGQWCSPRWSPRTARTSRCSRCPA